MKIILAVLLAAIQLANAQSAIWGQCGGQGWTGATTCASGSVCTFSNPYYSQCLPGTAPAPSSSSTVSASPTTTVTGPSPTSTGSGLPFLGGVNTAGYDFSVATDGSFNGTGVSPPVAQYSHFAAEGVNIFRIPFAWQLMTPTLGGTIDPTFFARYDSTVQSALSTGAYVIVDLHNYARWNGQVIGQGGPTNAQFASIWSQIAQKYASTSKIIFGVMNEPHDLPQGTALWAQSVQAAVNAIRAAGATSQVILIPGSSYSSAQTLPTEAGPDLLKVTDPAGGVGKLVFDVHKYLDSDNSGTHPDCTTDNVSVMQTLVAWLQQNGNRQALLSETGGGNTASCETYLNNELSYVKANSASIVGFAAWAAGAFATNYTLSLTPNSDGSDQPLWIQAIKPNLP
ncbi:glycoside hydrolase family 5 protein [Sphaerobolus stellatus SS14]|uniref:cellulase n=1 Tax=Sphaerobolus stellatus (strain SS14) TaxID=990650 RepID=A0A0C9UFH8_SPHS4|nr:glycoside hydrolase family 5 protein [Sphaerobolus stellatus SS14]